MKTTLLYVFMFCSFTLPVVSNNQTIAYSPSIPGQPLIFHNTTSLTSEELIYDEFSFEDHQPLIHLTKLSRRLSKELFNLMDHPHHSRAKNHANILFTIDQIYQTFLELKGSSSKEAAHLVKITLINFVHIAHAMSLEAYEFQYAYGQMQRQVINFYRLGLDDILEKSSRKSILRADAASALEGLVSCLTLALLKKDGFKNRNEVLLQVNKNLTIFVDTTFALIAKNNKFEEL